MLASPLKQSEWKNSLGNAQISLNTVAVMFLPSHNKPKTPIFLLCAVLFCHFNHISTNRNVYCYTIAMCNAFSGCMYSGFFNYGLWAGHDVGMGFGAKESMGKICIRPMFESPAVCPRNLKSYPSSHTHTPIHSTHINWIKALTKAQFNLPFLQALWPWLCLCRGLRWHGNHPRP